MRKVLSNGAVKVGLSIGLLMLAAILVVLEQRPRPAQALSPVTRTEQVITLAAAQTALQAPLARPRELGITSSIVVVDSQGNLKTMARMDGGSLFALGLVQDKAYT